ncbi:MAG: site-specific DNA-methyltransferase [Berryella intestinalis]|nr:site-specific DNA-methyltransferase [Berryella intestinalis]
MPELEIRELPVADLVPYANNAKKHPQKQVDEIAASISEFGNCDPIGVWHNERGEAEIVEGHGRVLALQKLGIETAPVIFLDHLTDEQRRTYTHVHNQTTLSSDFDYDALVADMDNLNMDWESFGFEDYIYDADEAAGVEDEGVPETVECRCKPGDVWTLGSHRVKCGSATDADDLENLVRGGVAQLLLTDPPYGVSYTGKTKDGLTIENDSKEDSELLSFLVAAFENAKAVMGYGAAFYVFHADSKGNIFRNALDTVGLVVRECLVWVKNSLVLGRQDYQWKHEPCLYGWKDGAAHKWYSDRKQTTVLEFDRPTANREHPTMKPVPLLAYLISNSTKEGDLVLDVFGGSGSTLLACEKLGRTCCMMELDPHYCDVIIQRWEDMTGKEAVLEGVK